MNVKSVRNTYSPKLRLFGLSWSNAKDCGYSCRCTEGCNQDTTSWPSPPNPTGKMMHDKGPVKVLAQAQALEWMLGLDECTPLPT